METINKIINKTTYNYFKKQNNLHNNTYPSNINTNNNNITNNTYFKSFTYQGHISDKINQTLKHFNIKTSFSTKNTIKNILCNAKDKTNLLDKNGIYELTCNDCRAKYIGETGRQLKLRIKEHIRDINISNFGRHLNYNNHKFDINKNTKLLHNTDKGLKQILFESFEIDKIINTQHVICLNDQTDLNFKPLYKYLNNPFNI